ncbi:hybrid sensor histidine kinase/response regulator [Haloarcula salina]|uniref:histidine kinase n=1 Tax=Haloarcula salina TaxID=1429914 RepID=A0AA41G1I9_9EURY|nr:PAS domain S-box protein [Haloarcula salina]MBV0902687.1 PAS domain S-box protein [Haloarcula salina]
MGSQIGLARAHDAATESDGQIRVLHVDDEPNFAETTAMFLQQESERITVEAETAPQRVRSRLDEADFDCIVSDYQMPGLDGLEVLEEVRAEYPNVPFILFTGKGSEEVASESISLGVTDYLQKEGGTDQFAVLANRIENAVARVRAEEAASDYKRQLEHRDRELERILAATPDAVVIVDEDGVIRQLNESAADLFEYEQEALRGKSVEELMPEQYRKEHVTLREEYVEDPTPRPMGAGLDLTAVRRGGERFPVEISLGPLHIDGETRIMATITDITERKRREQELKRQNKRLDEFASIVSHDLRAPLGLATANHELVSDNCEGEAVERLGDALDRMDALIDDLLTFARQGTQVIDASPVPLTRAVNSAWTATGADEATLDVPDELDTIVCDEARLLQLLENLFRNARAHGGDEVTVRVGPLSDGFYVADDGPGIPASEREKVFETGYSTAEDGTGFGLAIVEQIVDAHGWSIRVAASEESGARFEVTGVTVK